MDGAGLINVIAIPINRVDGAYGASTVRVVPSQPASVASGFVKYVYGTDYEFASGTSTGSTVSFADGQTSATVQVRLKNTALTKKGVFKLTLETPEGGASPGAAPAVSPASSCNGLFNGKFTHSDGSVVTYREVILNKGGNQDRPRLLPQLAGGGTYGATGQSGRVVLAPFGQGVKSLESQDSGRGQPTMVDPRVGLRQLAA